MLNSSFTLSEPKALTHNQLDKLVTQITSALLHLSITSPSTPLASRPRASIYADTSLNWQLFSQAFARLGIVITTAYTTLGEEGLLTSLVEPNVEIIFCGEGQLEMVSKVIEKATRVKWVVYDTQHQVNQVHIVSLLLTSSGHHIPD